MNGKGCHDSDASILKSDSPFAWQQHSLLAPSPLKTAAFLFLPVDAMSEEKDFIPMLSPTWRKLSSVCHTDTGPVTVLYGELDTTIPALCCLRSAAELPHLGQRCILIITILLRPFCLIQLFLNGWRLTAWLSFFWSHVVHKKAFGYTVNSLALLVPNQEILACLIYFLYGNRAKLMSPTGAQ